MIRGLYAAASGMVAQMARQDVYADNLANVNSVGFRRGQAVLQEFPVDLAGGAASGGTGAGTAGLDLSQGPLVSTQRTLDLAIKGDGFFVVQTPRGVSYTRNGQFQLDSQQHLVTNDGYPVLGDSGPITVSSPDFVVSSDGTVTCAGATAGKLSLVAVSNPQALGSGYYGGRASRTSDSEVCQGSLEQSNVNAVQEMGRMMNGYRFYEANAAALRYQDETISSLMKVAQ